VTVRTFEIDGHGIRGFGVRSSAHVIPSYDLTVVSTDVGDTVRAAGGWLCDRVRAGWNVRVLVESGQDPRPLAILGLVAHSVSAPAEALRQQASTALAVSAALLSAHDDIADVVRAVVDEGITEVTLWGGSGVPQVSGVAARVAPVAHSLSTAALAFKAQALLAVGDGPAQSGTQWCSRVEEFHSCALWYPPECSDLTPVGRSHWWAGQPLSGPSA
jgi:hypothetical protein